jgi:hypothetical protein
MHSKEIPLDKREIHASSESRTSSVSELIALLDATRTEYINPDRLTDFAEFTFRRIVMHAEFALSFLLNTQSYEERVLQLEAQGLCTSDAQAVVDAEDMRFLDAQDL